MNKTLQCLFYSFLLFPFLFPFIPFTLLNGFPDSLIHALLLSWSTFIYAPWLWQAHFAVMCQGHWFWHCQLCRHGLDFPLSGRKEVTTTKSCHDCRRKGCDGFSLSIQEIISLNGVHNIVWENNNISLNVYFIKLLDLYGLLFLFLTKKNFISKVNDDDSYDRKKNVTFSSISIKIFTWPLLCDCL